MIAFDWFYIFLFTVTAFAIVIGLSAIIAGATSDPNKVDKRAKCANTAHGAFGVAIVAAIAGFSLMYDRKYDIQDITWGDLSDMQRRQLKSKAESIFKTVVVA
jgi:hypothetical protein